METLGFLYNSTTAFLLHKAEVCSWVINLLVYLRDRDLKDAEYSSSQLALTTTWVGIPAVRMPTAHFLKTCNICGIVLCAKTLRGTPVQWLCCLISILIRHACQVEENVWHRSEQSCCQYLTEINVLLVFTERERKPKAKYIPRQTDMQQYSWGSSPDRREERQTVKGVYFTIV